MTTTIRDQGPFEKILTLQVPAAEVESAKNRVARKLSQELKIKGFRPGKAPRPIVEAAVGGERLRSEAIEELLPTVVGAALQESELAPAVAPSVETMRELDDGLEVEVLVTMWPKLEAVPSYRGRRVELPSPEVTQDDLDRQVERLREQFAELETVVRPATQGDFVSMHLSAFQGGKPLDDISADELLYELGSRSFIEGLDENLLGKAVGEFAKFDAPLPDGLGESGGSQATFHVLVKEVKQRKLPELSDDWVMDATEFGTVDELRADLERRLGEVKLGSVRAEFHARLVDELVDDLQVEVPAAIQAAEMDSILHRFAHRLQQQGITIEDYLEVTGLDQAGLLDDLRQQADRNLRVVLLLEAVAESEGIDVGTEEVDRAVEALAGRSDDPAQFLRRFRESSQVTALRGDILRQKALAALVAAAIPIDGVGNVLDLRVRDADQPQELGLGAPPGEDVVGDQAGGETLEADGTQRRDGLGEESVATPTEAEAMKRKGDS